MFKTFITQHGGVPRFYFQFLCDLEVALAVALMNAKGKRSKNMSAANIRDLNYMKLLLLHNNENYASVME